MVKFPKFRAEKAREEKEARLTPKRALTGVSAFAGAVGCGYLLVKGYGSTLVDTGAGIFLGATSWEAFNVKRGNVSSASDRIRNTRIGTRVTRAFGAGLVVVGLVSAVGEVTADKASKDGISLPTTVPTGVLTPNPISEAGGYCGITAPFPKGKLTDAQKDDAKHLQEYTSGLVLPDGKQLPEIARDDNNYKTEDSQLSRNVTAIQIYYGLDPKQPWNPETCAKTPFWQP